MMRKTKIDEIINNVGYGVEVPEDKESRFKMRRLVEHVYKQGIIDGQESAKKVEILTKQWSEEREMIKPDPNEKSFRLNR